MASGTGIKAELLDELLKGQDPKTLFEQDGLLDELKKALAERALNAELVLRNVPAGWTRPPIAWQAAKAQFALQFEERFVIGGE
jgi:transposase-like protein